MCGIAGAVGLADEQLIREMAARIAHRGPDDEGFWLNDDGATPVMLASRRLAILDLSAAGHMPMESSDGRFVIIYNGEVYNFRELREVLKALGHEFRSESDTEVVLASFVEWGPACVERFNGMFAIAIWNRRDEELFLARDRVGIKPLYYVADESRLLFGSEVKSMLVDGLHKAELSRSALASFLKYQYVPWPNTMFEGVKKLPPAHYALFKNGELTLRRYWQPPDRGAQAEPSTEELSEILEDAVKKRLVSDVPIGVFLSGGIDSSIIAGLSARHLPELITYTVGFDGGGERFDETGAAKVVADFLGAENRLVKCTAQDAAEHLPSLLLHLDEPVADNLLYPFFALSREARKAFTVALSGEGADEIFFGYRYYTLEAIRRRASRFVPAVLRRYAASKLMLKDRTRDPRCRAVVYVSASTERDAFHAWSSSFFSPQQLESLIGQNWLENPDTAAGMDEVLPKVELGESGCLSPFYDFHFRMVDYILAIRDKMSMAVGLEVRTPFLDHRLIEAAFAVPVERKLRGKVTKHALREVVDGVLPTEVSARAKVPFAAPVHLWQQPLANKYLSDSELVHDGVLQSQAVTEWSEFDGDGAALYPHKLWSILVLEIWYRIFITRSLKPALVSPAERGT